MKVLYLSSLISPNRIDELSHFNGGKIPFATQKFNWLIVNGLLGNKAELSTLSAIPVMSSASKKTFFWKKEKYNGVLFPYLDFGILGVIIISFLLGLFVRSAIRKLYKYKSIFLMILVNQCYIMAIYSIFDFRGIANPSTVVLMLVLYLSNYRLIFAGKLGSGIIRRKSETSR